MSAADPTVMARRARSRVPTASRDNARPSHEPRYHSFTTVTDVAGFLDTVTDQVATWLRGKGLDLCVDRDVDVALDTDAGPRTLSYRRHQNGHEAAILFALTDPSPIGLWNVEVMAGVHRETGWLSIETTSSEHRWIDVPRFVPALMDLLHVREGGRDLSARPWNVAPNQVSQLVALLEDSSRRAPVFVAGTDISLPFDPFVTQVSKWTRQVQGLSHVAVLQPDSVPAFADAVGASLRTDPWTIRTYQPRFSLGDPSRQHRVLSTARLGSDRDDYIRRLLGRISRTAIAHQPIADELAEWRRTFDRLETRRLTDALVAPRHHRHRRTAPGLAAPDASSGALVKTSIDAPTVHEPTLADVASDSVAIASSEVDAAIDSAVAAAVAALEARQRAETSRVLAALGIPNLDDETLVALIDELTDPGQAEERDRAAADRLAAQQERIDVLERKISDYKMQTDAIEREHTETRSWADEQERRARWLQQQLIEAAEYDRAFSSGAIEDAVGQQPESFEDLVECEAQLDRAGIVLSVDRSDCVELDALDGNGKVLDTTWHAIRTLADYVRAKREGHHEGDVESFLKNTPRAYTRFPPGKHARGETDATMNAYGDERVFRVPTGVDSRGTVTMTAHFRLGCIGMSSPRMYYLDQVAEHQRVIIGYIGAHLRNTQTN